MLNLCLFCLFLPMIECALSFKIPCIPCAICACLYFIYKYSLNIRCSKGWCVHNYFCTHNYQKQYNWFQKHVYWFKQTTESDHVQLILILIAAVVQGWNDGLWSKRTHAKTYPTQNVPSFGQNVPTLLVKTYPVHQNVPNILVKTYPTFWSKRTQYIFFLIFNIYFILFCRKKVIYTLV